MATHQTAATSAVQAEQTLSPGLLDQIVECFFYSNYVEEVFASDLDLRRKMAPILKRHMSVEDDLDREVRARIKHVEEGTPAWEIEYQKTLELVRRTKGVVK